MKEIKLTQGKVALVDDEDYEYLNQWKWHAYRWPGSKKAIDNFYAFHYFMINGRRQRMAMHRILLNPPEKMVVDHFDRNGLNNQKSNLRVCDQATNVRNSSRCRYPTNYKYVYKTKGKKEYTTISGEKKIYYCKDFVYVAMVRINKKCKILGRFRTEIEAAESVAKYMNIEIENLRMKIFDSHGIVETEQSKKIIKDLVKNEIIEARAKKELKKWVDDYKGIICLHPIISKIESLL